jgi:putative oxidoreductase
MIGRIIFAMMFVGSGVGHLMDSDGSTRYAEGKGIGNANSIVQISGAALLAGGVGTMLGILIDLVFAGVGVLVLIIGPVLDITP